MKFTGYILLLFIVAIFLMSFSFFKRTYVEIAQDIRNKIGKELAKKHRMDLVAVGGGMMDCVRHISLSYQIYHTLNQDEARCLIVDCVEELLKAFNENEKIRPHLQNYPFTVENLDVAIFISTPQHKSVYYPDFGIVSVYYSDSITYKREDESGKSLPSIREPYQEALDKVKNNGRCSQNMPLQSRSLGKSDVGT